MAAARPSAPSELLAAVVSDDVDIVQELRHQACIPSETWWRALTLARQRTGSDARVIVQLIIKHLKRGLIPRPTGATEIVQQLADHLQPSALSIEEKALRNSKVAIALGLLLRALSPAAEVVSLEVYQQKVDDLAALISAALICYEQEEEFDTPS